MGPIACTEGRIGDRYRLRPSHSGLDDYDRVREWLDKLNRTMIERGVHNTPRTLPDGRIFTERPIPLSATEIIRSALMLATSAIEADQKGVEAPYRPNRHQRRLGAGAAR